MAYGLPFLEKMSPVMQLAYACGCKQIMCMVANGLWLVFLVKMRPSDAILAYVCGLQMAYARGCKWLMFFLFTVYFCIILPMK